MRRRRTSGVPPTHCVMSWKIELFDFDFSAISGSLETRNSSRHCKTGITQAHTLAPLRDNGQRNEQNHTHGIGNATGEQALKCAQPDHGVANKNADFRLSGAFRRASGLSGQFSVMDGDHRRVPPTGRQHTEPTFALQLSLAGNLPHRRGRGLSCFGSMLAIRNSLDRRHRQRCVLPPSQ